MAAPPESLHFQRSQAVSESAPSALYSPDLSKRRTPSANTDSDRSMTSRISISGSPSDTSSRLLSQRGKSSRAALIRASGVPSRSPDAAMLSWWTRLATAVCQSPKDHDRYRCDAGLGIALRGALVTVAVEHQRQHFGRPRRPQPVPAERRPELGSQSPGGEHRAHACGPTGLHVPTDVAAG